MSEKRMFSQQIIDSDDYLDLPFSAQSLYFQLCMRADDDGLIDNVKKVMRITGCKDGDLKKLISSGFLLFLGGNVYAVTHWNIHNTIRSDRRKPSNHVAELSRLSLDEAGKYLLKTDNQVPANCQPSDNQMTTNCQPDDGQMTGSPQPNVRVDIDIDIEKDKGIGREGVEEDNTKVFTRAAEPETALPLQPLPELDQNDIAIIVENWNKQTCTQNISNIPLMRQRYNNTRECIGGDLNQFIRTIRSLDSQAFFRNRLKQNVPVKYDWFVDPNNYQKVVEGNYQNEYKAKGEDDGLKFGW